MMRFGLSLLALMLCALVVPAAAKKKEKAAVEGLITRVTPAKEEYRKKGLLGTIRVEGKKGLNSTYDQAFAVVTTKTRISMRFGPEKKYWNFDDLRKGRKVLVYGDKEVLPTDPVQVIATEIIILEEAK